MGSGEDQKDLMEISSDEDELEEKITQIKRRKVKNRKVQTPPKRIKTTTVGKRKPEDPLDLERCLSEEELNSMADAMEKVREVMQDRFVKISGARNMRARVERSLLNFETG